MAGSNHPSTANAPGFGRQRKSKFSKKASQTQRPLDPAMLLSRGLSARFVGANIPLTANGQASLAPLNKDEMEKDLRLMNAYYQANVSYAQQHFMYMNRGQAGLTTSAAMMNTPVPINATNGEDATTVYQDPGLMAPMVAMPVRIDPEEEKRLSNLRRKIALCETQREFLESQYVSLRAHYVATTKELASASKHNEALVVFLQSVTQRRARVLALQRARLQIARDVAACLQTRLQGLQAAGGGASTAVNGEATHSNGNGNGNARNVDGASGDDTANATAADKMDIDSPEKSSTAATAAGETTTPATTSNDGADLIQVWNEMEDMLLEAELACRKIPSSLTLQDKKRKKSKKKDKENAANANVKEVPQGDDPTKFGILPWEAIKLPNTPQGVPLYLSQLAVVPEKGAAYGGFI